MAETCESLSVCGGISSSSPFHGVCCRHRNRGEEELFFARVGMLKGCFPLDDGGVCGGNGTEKERGNQRTRLFCPPLLDM